MNNDWIIIGKFGRPKWLSGFIVVNSFTDPYDNILNYLPWYIIDGNCKADIIEYFQLLIVDQKFNNKNILVKIKDYNSCENVANLTNIDILINKKQLPQLKLNDYYWRDLIGMQVFNDQDLFFGMITSIMPTGSNDVLIVDGEKRHLIPYLPNEFIINVDTEHHKIIVNWDYNF